ncbi:MAG: rhodanese-like domain-containing protein [Gammaproteobacteria bacterium]|nr:rhodanese-like domain-containing protein [Gammaproteobacteria bacterium]MBT8110881.1 rhodanese-like domain-containing protein [Gammaproteobacteria bacterium]NND47024.1 rhodanese-like domain-containing protein [Woeseiaceae bacterium]NNL45579.1 rhodanese-like domain-containing protein [Woeseiaceae bacterium]
MDKFLEFTSNHMLLVSALMISFFVVVFTELRRKASGLINIEAGDAVKLINNDAVVVDIRSPDAFARGHIVNAKNIPADELDAKIEQLSKYKSTPIVAVCDAGITTTKTVVKLRESGFESVFGLKGGMSGWGQAGLPVVTGKKTRGKSNKQKKRSRNDQQQ